MRTNTWFCRAGWLGVLGAALLWTGSVMAVEVDSPFRLPFSLALADEEAAAEGEEAAEAPQTDDDVEAEPAAEPARSDYWIGVAADEELSVTLRSQLGLPEGQGLLIMSVLEDSPAAKAGLKEHDVLLSAGGKPLANLQDLVAVVGETGEKELALEVVRGGEKMTVTVTPAKRPADQGFLRDRFREVPGFSGEDGERIGKWMEEFAPGREGRWFVPRPGIVLPPGEPHVVPLPEGMSVTITKEGAAPAKIVVKQGDKSWETTEDKLSELPDEVRGPVQALLGRPPLGIIRFRENLEARPRPPRPSAEERQERLDRLSQQLERLQKAIDELREEPAEGDQE